MRLSQLPNAVTLMRILLVLPMAWLLWRVRYPEALLLVAVAGISDAVDGALARRFNWRSEFGALLDPLADKAMVVVLFVALAMQGQLPLWLAAVVVTRDAVILAGAAVYRLLFGKITMAPTLVSKTNTAVQVVVLLLVLFGLCGFGAVSEMALQLADPACFYLVALLSILSGLDYVVTWSLKAWRKSLPAVDS